MPWNLCLSLACLLGPLQPFAQAPPFDDPVALTEAFVRGQVDPPSEALTGEAADNPVSAARLPRAQELVFDPQWSDAERALVAVEFVDTSFTQDLYVFLTKEKGWRIEAFRSFDLPGVFFMQLNHYRGKSERALRSEYEQKFRKSAARGVSREEHEAAQGDADALVFRVFNLRLTAGSDAELARHWEVLRKQFDELRLALAELPASETPVTHGDPLGEDLGYLLLQKAYHGQGPLRLEVGGVDGDRVGYLYCTSAECMPTPTPGGVITLKELGDGWYLYRTT